MSAITQRDGPNYNYTTAASIIDVNSNVIQRTTVSSDSNDYFSVAATDLMLGFLGSTAAQYNGSSVSVVIQNTSTTNTITMGVGFVVTITNGGSGYNASGSGIAVTGGSGTGMLISYTSTGGVVDSITFDDIGTGYVGGDTGLTFTDTGTGVAFNIASTGITISPSSTYLIAPEGSAKFTFFKDSTTAIVVMAENSRTLYGPTTATTNNSIIVFDGTSGQLSAGTGVTIDASDNIAGIGTISVTDLILRDGDTNTITLTAPADVTPSNYTITFPAAVGSSGQVLQTVDGAGTLAWVTPAAGVDSSFSAYGPNSSTGTDLSATFVRVEIDTTNVIDGTNYSLDTVTNVGRVTITNAGDYMVSFTVQFQTLDLSGGKDASFGGRLNLNGTTVPGSTTECYVNEFNGDLIRPSVTKTLIIAVTAGNFIDLEAARTAGTATGQLRVDECSLILRRLN